MLSSSPDCSGNPFCFCLKKQKDCSAKRDKMLLKAINYCYKNKLIRKKSIRDSKFTFIVRKSKL